MVERICGVPKETFLKVAEVVTSTGNAQKVGTIMYALGWTQHSIGVQIIRTAAMLQLLLGNVGRPGGGVNALRGHSNIQGATDMGGNIEILPGYLKTPTSGAWRASRTTSRQTTPTTLNKVAWASMNYWQNYPKFMVSLLKALWGAKAHEGERLRLRVAAEGGRQLFVDATCSTTCTAAARCGSAARSPGPRAS